MKRILLGMCCLMCLVLALSAGYFISYSFKESKKAENEDFIGNESVKDVVDGGAISEGESGGGLSAADGESSGDLLAPAMDGEGSGNLLTPAMDGEGGGNLLTPAMEQEDKVDMDTKYQLITEDIGEKTKSSKRINVPNEWMGMTRSELEKWMHDYVDEPPLYEVNNGLLSFELVSFSSDLIKAKKTYLKDMVMYKYYIGIRNNMVVVYYSDKKTVYEYTGINCKTLPMEERKKLNYGIYVRDEGELYGILEDYSS